MKTTNKKTKKSKRFNGGKVLTSGGFGCLFKPALQCENHLLNRSLDEKIVTKLMTKKHADDEYKQITKFKSILDHIPNYPNYFLVDGFTKCKPKLTEEDLKDFDENCDALTKKKITTSNINKNLDNILALNMPDGGIDVDDYVFSIEDPLEIRKIYTDLNNSLIDLLINGIEPMNRANLYHCDVKGSNILVKETELKADSSLMTRLIDWGLSIYTKNDVTKRISTEIPDKLDRRPFQFNVPFSVILFNKKFLEKYGKFLEKYEQIDYYSIREFVINYIFYWNKARGPGHLKTINSIVKHLSYNELYAIDNKKVKNHVIEYEFTYYYIVEYIAKILFKYTVKDNNKNNLNLLEYFNQIFLKNIDVWGLTMIYMIFLDHIQENIDTENDNINVGHNQFIQKIKFIIIHFLFETPTEVININKLATELQSLNKLIAKFNEPNTETNSINYFASLKKIDTSHLKEVGGSIRKKTKSKSKSKTKSKTKSRTIKKRAKSNVKIFKTII